MSIFTQIRKNLKLHFIGIFFAIFTLPSAHANEDLQVHQKDKVSDATSRIVGGVPVPAGERTFQVGLMTRDEAGELKLGCGGSIIADSWVMTAAHCVQSGRIVKILSGTRLLNSGGNNSGGHTHSIAEVISHPDFIEAHLGNDIALIKINGTFASSLERLKLATTEITSSAALPGIKSIVSGWGSTSNTGNNAQRSNRLLQATNTLVSASQCHQFGGNIDTSTIICANDPGSSSCNGDNGGPLTVSSKGQTYSIGIVSFGPVVCSGSSAYANTASLRSWVSQHVDIDNGGSDNGGSDNNPLTLNGNVLSWPSEGWWQIQDEAAPHTEVCNTSLNGTSCQLDVGTYLAINHTTGERYTNIVVLTRPGPNPAPTEPNAVPMHSGNVLFWPSKGWWQVQDAAAPHTERCNTSLNGTSCQLKGGTYQVINHTNGQRYEITIPN